MKKKIPDTQSIYQRITIYLVLLAIVIINVLIVPELSDILQFDISANGLYTLSEQTKRVISGIQNPVEVYLICERGSADTKINWLLRQYQKLSNQLTIMEIDPTLNPTFVQTYTDIQLANNSLIITNGTQTRILRNSEIYVSDYDYDTGETAAVFDGEGQLTSAIRYVSEGAGAVIYEIGSVAENIESFSSKLQKDGLELRKLQLLKTGSVPQDASCIFVYATADDLTQQEYEELSAYLSRGGRLLLITSPELATHKRLDELLAQYGLFWREGIIFEADANYYVPTYPTYLLPLIGSHTITTPLLAQDSLILQPGSHAIHFDTSAHSTLQAQTLLLTTEKSYMKDNSQTYSQTDADENGPFITGIAISEDVSDEQTRLVWFSCSNMLLEQIDTLVNGNNTDLVLNAIGWLTETENNITLRPRILADTSLRMNAAHATAWGCVYTLVLPVLFAVAGICVSRYRKRRK